MPYRRQSSDELAREENEAVDLQSIDITKTYSSPTKLQKALVPVNPPEEIPDNLFAAAKPVPSAEAQGGQQAPAKEEEEQKKNKKPEERPEDPKLSPEENEELRTTFAVYNLNYDFETGTYLDLQKIQTQYLETPTERAIYKFCKKIMIHSKMEKEIPILALIYVEKLMLRTGLLMNELNWRRFTFIALVLASKVWDDESFENVHFTKVFPDITIEEINELERIYLYLLDYKLNINGSEYAKYYFILRTLSERAHVKFPLQPMPLARVLELQRNAKRVQANLRAAPKTNPYRQTH